MLEDIDVELYPQARRDLIAALIATLPVDDLESYRQWRAAVGVPVPGAES